MKAKKTKSGRWKCQAYVGRINGKQVIKSFTADTKKEAEYLASQYLRNHTIDEGRLTVEQAIDQYIAAKEAVLSPSTVRGYRTMQRNYYDEIGGISIYDLTTKQVQQWVADWSLKVSPKSVSNMTTLLLSSLNMFVPERRFSITMPKRVKREKTVPCDEEVRLLIREANPQLKLCICLAAIGTLRRGEICALKYEDISTDLNSVHVHADFVLNDKNELVYKPTPKTAASDRIVVLPKEVIDMFNKTPESTGFVFNFQPDNITHMFGRLRNKLCINVRFHDLRGYSASIMHAIGVPDQYIQLRGGWQTDQVMKTVYRNALADKNKEFTEKTNGYFSNKLVNF